MMELLFSPVSFDVKDFPLSFFNGHFNTPQSVTTFVTNNVLIIQSSFSNTIYLTSLKCYSIFTSCFLILCNHCITRLINRVCTRHSCCRSEVNLEDRIISIYEEVISKRAIQFLSV